MIPLVVSQVVNLLAETLVPYCLLKVGRHAVKVFHPGTVSQSSLLLSQRSAKGMHNFVTTRQLSSHKVGAFGKSVRELGRDGSVGHIAVLGGRSKEVASRSDATRQTQELHHAIVRVSTKGVGALDSHSERMLSRLRLKLAADVRVLDVTDDGCEYTYVEACPRAWIGGAIAHDLLVWLLSPQIWGCVAPGSTTRIPRTSRLLGCVLAICVRGVSVRYVANAATSLPAVVNMAQLRGDVYWCLGHGTRGGVAEQRL